MAEGSDAASSPTGALADGAPNGPYLAAQWLGGASFAFGASEDSARVDMSSARARTRAALLVARLVMNGEDADQGARAASIELDRLGELAFGDGAGASPVDLAHFALGRGFDLHDASAIAGAAFANADVKVNHVTAASPAALVVDLTVGATAALGPTDVTVTDPLPAGVG